VNLPALICMADHGGNWDAYLAAIYAVFRADFVTSPPVCGTRRWGLKKYPMEAGKEATFWHFTSEGRVEADRIPDFRRCERIGYVKPIVNAIGTDDVCCWEQSRGGERRLAVALPDFSYLTIIADRGSYVLPWTAFYVERDRDRQKFERDWKAGKLVAPW
jgi:hypothetical protein